MQLETNLKFFSTTLNKDTLLLSDDMVNKVEKGNETVQLEFDVHQVSPRKDLLHFVEENLTSKVYEGLGNNTRQWIEELDIVSSLLTGEGLCALINAQVIHQPPQDDPEFRQLGENVFLYRGEEHKARGLWLSKESTQYDIRKDEEIPYTQWTRYRMGSHGILKINTNFQDIPHETFLPENFEPKSKTIKDNKRPVLVFDVSQGDKTLTVYAKGAEVTIYRLFEPPSYRLTNLSNISKVTSKKEMEMSLELAAQGVKIPPIIGYYKSPVEEFLFLKNVEGEKPCEYLSTHKKEIIEQDAEMLAVLCLLGYRKIGFNDFDDKIFDGENLYLIDVEELRDLYYPMKYKKFKDMLLNPTDTSKLDEFREGQKSLFKTALKDALYDYRDSLTPTFDDQVGYVDAFYKRVGWGKPPKSKIKELTGFPDDYMTVDRYMSMMADNL